MTAVDYAWNSTAHCTYILLECLLLNSQNCHIICFDMINQAKMYREIFPACCKNHMNCLKEDMSKMLSFPLAKDIRRVGDHRVRREV
jgi:hypothetical protein